MTKRNIECDLAVVGAGICGSAVASIAAENGLRVVLADKGDLGGGTSCATSKMLHGGIRYLANREFGLIRECLSDREEVLRKLPFAARRTPYVFRGTGSKRLVNAAGIGLYGALNEFRDSSPHQSTWYEYTAHDSQIVFTLVRNAVRCGCEVLTYSGLNGIKLTGNSVASMELDECEIIPKHVVFCLGAWTDAVLGRVLPDWKPVLSLSRGIHLVAGKRIYPHDYATAFETRRDSRFVMIIPFHDCVLIGTTESAVDDPVESDVAYLIDETRRYLSCRIESHIYGITSGVRPLVKQPVNSTYDASREELILKPLQNCVVCVGGKLTNFLTISRKIFDAIPGMTVNAARWITPSAETKLYFNIARHPERLTESETEYLFRTSLCKYPSDLIFRRLPTKYIGLSSADEAKRLMKLLIPFCGTEGERQFQRDFESFYSLKYPPL